MREQGDPPVGVHQHTSGGRGTGTFGVGAGPLDVPGNRGVAALDVDRHDRRELPCLQCHDTLLRDDSRRRRRLGSHDGQAGADGILDPEVEAAWGAAYGLLSGVMIEAARAA